MIQAQKNITPTPADLAATEPCAGCYQPTDGKCWTDCGMTLRDWFAGQALANLYTHSESNPDRVAEWAYQVADAMLAARKGGAL